MDAQISTLGEPAPAYSLRCVRCGHSVAGHEDRHTVLCPGCGRESFLRTDFAAAGLRLAGPAAEYASYRRWLPFAWSDGLPGLRIGCVPAPGLGRSLGLSNLWLLISGFAPELGADLPTCTFKTLEAAGVMQRVHSQTDQVLIVSSAGNAGCAVLELGARLGRAAVVVVPEAAASDMLTSAEPGWPRPLLICLRQATYPDAIALVGEIQGRFPDRLVREGGAYNVARRDAMGVPFLRAAQAIGRIPDHYFQAVGSGTGGIAAHEAARRLAGAGFEGGPPRLHLVQNSPFTPMVDAWRKGSERIEPMERAEVRRRLAATRTSVLANANPPWGVAGGVRDVLLESGGQMLAVDNDQVEAGCAAIAEHLALLPYAEGGAALAGLEQIQRGPAPIGADEVVLVHLTGAGQAQSIEALGRRPYPVDVTCDPDDVATAAARVEDYLARALA